MILRVPWRHFLRFSDISNSRKNPINSEEDTNSFLDNRIDKFIKILLAVKF